MSQIAFYALPEDLTSVMLDVESTINIKYHEFNHFKKGAERIYSSFKEIPESSIARGAASTLCDSYLVSQKDTHINGRHIDGTELFSFDQLFNPDSIVMNPGGVWGNSILLAGRISTASDSEEAKKFLRVFQKCIKKKFVRVKVYWVGPEAFQFFEKGGRLTMAEQSPSEYDLAI